MIEALGGTRKLKPIKSLFFSTNNNRETMHLFSESAIWKTASEFISPDGKISKAFGETSVIVKANEIKNNSWASFGELKRVNDYAIKVISKNELTFESLNPELGIQKGKFNIDRNIIYSKFTIENTKLNGFEIIRREHDLCYANGALYDGENLINTWVAIMTKQ
ncbi:hypothetical protein V6R21_07220 [Limibacter armeniacum]|uniref:hypothetical protein n=1 Tax=Limibacter armeniacum TaxID=466084 RepID=UPI002FE59069